MTTEEKAKAYDKAFEIAENIHRFSSNIAEIKRMEDLFPELKESEDEKIRKELITHCRNTRCVTEEGAERIAKWIAWLEKQGKKNLAHVEPKFKVGDWCIDNKDGVIFQIMKVLDNTYTYKTNDGKEYSCTHYSLENDAKLWTIKDAKDGDVLSDGTTIFIFKDLLSDGSVMSYCDYDADSGESDAFCPLSVNLVCSKITPATKEQRDLLFQKIKEAGYEWDSEKKELKKIEQKPQRIVAAKAKEALYCKPEEQSRELSLGKTVIEISSVRHRLVADTTDAEQSCKECSLYALCDNFGCKPSKNKGLCIPFTREGEKAHFIMDK